jgi:hypothetical protein
MSGYRVVTGLTLVLVSGLVGARALSSAGDPELARLFAAGFALAAGLYLIVTGRQTPAPRPDLSRPAASPRPPPAPEELQRVSGQFLLGDMLLTRLPRLRQLHIDAALRKQRGSGQRLGQIMIEMGLITPAELEDALRLQAHLRRRGLNATARDTRDEIDGDQDRR